MRIVQVVPSLETEASGPTYTVQALSRSMSQLGAQVTVVAAALPDEPTKDGVTYFPRRNFLDKLGRSPEMLRWLRAQALARHVDILHGNSLWMMPNVYPGWVAAETGVPLVVSPRGTLAPLARKRSKFVKAIFWRTLQKRSIALASMFHATAESELLDIRRTGFTQPIALVPMGIDLQPAFSKRREGVRILLYLGRLHPIKGIDGLLQAWARLQARYPDWGLRIVGPGEPAHVRELHDMAARLRLSRVEFAAPLYGADKHRAYGEADLFVLPSHSENFGVVVAESLAMGTPVITTRGTPWAALPEQEVGWYIDCGVEPLIAALDLALAMPRAALEGMGVKGRNWVQREFAWKEIGSRMLRSYQWLLEGGERPTWIDVK